MKTILIKWNDRFPEEVTNELEKTNFTINTLAELIPILDKLR
jgi:hypothetical protein